MSYITAPPAGVEQMQLRQTVDRSYKLTKESYFKLVVGHTTKHMKHSFMWHSNMMTLGWKCRTRAVPSCEGCALVRHFQPRIHYIRMSDSLRASSVHCQHSENLIKLDDTQQSAYLCQVTLKSTHCCEQQEAGVSPFFSCTETSFLNGTFTFHTSWLMDYP